MRTAKSGPPPFPNCTQEKSEIEEVRKVWGGKEEDGEMVIVKLAQEEQKWEIMKRKNRLIGRKERIFDE